MSQLKDILFIEKLKYQNGIYSGYVVLEEKQFFPEGEGIFYFDDGQMFYGFWSEGEPLGKGILFFSHGGFMIFESERGEQKSCGFIEIIYPNKDYFGIQCKNGVFEGEGVRYFSKESTVLEVSYKGGELQSFRQNDLQLKERAQFDYYQLILNNFGLSEIQSRFGVFLVNEQDLYFGGVDQTQIQSKQPQGLGILLNDLEFTRGFFDQGQVCGQGRKIIQISGDVYDGNFLEGDFSGQGVYYNNEESTWVKGDFFDNKIFNVEELGNGFFPPCISDFQGQEQQQQNQSFYQMKTENSAEEHFINQSVSINPLEFGGAEAFYLLISLHLKNQVFIEEFKQGFWRHENQEINKKEKNQENDNNHEELISGIIEYIQEKEKQQNIFRIWKIVFDQQEKKIKKQEKIFYENTQTQQNSQNSQAQIQNEFYYYQQSPKQKTEQIKKVVVVSQSKKNSIQFQTNNSLNPQIISSIQTNNSQTSQGFSNNTNVSLKNKNFQNKKQHSSSMTQQQLQLKQNFPTKQSLNNLSQAARKSVASASLISNQSSIQFLQRRKSSIKTLSHSNQIQKKSLVEGFSIAKVLEKQIANFLKKSNFLIDEKKNSKIISKNVSPKQKNQKNHSQFQNNPIKIEENFDQNTEQKLNHNLTEDNFFQNQQNYSNYQIQPQDLQNPYYQKEVLQENFASVQNNLSRSQQSQNMSKIFSPRTIQIDLRKEIEKMNENTKPTKKQNQKSNEENVQVNNSYRNYSQTSFSSLKDILKNKQNTFYQAEILPKNTLKNNSSNKKIKPTLIGFVNSPKNSQISFR